MGTGLLDGADGRLLGENICPCVEGVFSANPGPWPGQSLLDTLSVRVKGTALRTVLATCPSPRFTCLLRSFLAMWVKDFSSVFKAHFESWSRCAAPLSGAKGGPSVWCQGHGSCGDRRGRRGRGSLPASWRATQAPCACPAGTLPDTLSLLLLPFCFCV